MQVETKIRLLALVTLTCAPGVRTALAAKDGAHLHHIEDSSDTGYLGIAIGYGF